MADVDRLIDRLTADAAPVKPIASPLARTLLWLLIALGVIACVLLVFGVRQHFIDSMHVPQARMEWLASIATGVLGAYATFQVSVPGRSKRWALLPLPAAALWLSTLCWGCLEEASRMGPAALAFESATSECAQAIAFTALPIGALLLLMVRHAGVVRPHLSAALAAMTAAALSAASVTMYHGGESALMVLVWHVGAVLALSAACWLLGRPLFAWIGHARRGGAMR